MSDRLRSEMSRFLTWLEERVEEMYADPGIVPGSTFDEKVHNLIRPHMPANIEVVVKGRFDIREGRRYSIDLRLRDPRARAV